MIIRIIPGDDEDIISTEILVDFVPSENIPAYQYVTGSGYWADSTNPAHRGNIIGIIKESATLGIPSKAVSIGQVKNPLWVFVKGDRLFLNAKILQNAMPLTGDFSQSLAVVVATDIIDVLIKNPIRL